MLLKNLFPGANVKNMNSNKFGFRLRVRKQKLRFIRLINSNKTKKFFGYLLILVNLLLVVLGILLTTQSNKIATTALKLSLNDTSQQAQINELKGILLNIQKQNEIAEQQVNELIKINREANGLNKSNNELMAISNGQSNLMNKQLSLSIKRDSTETANRILGDESDLVTMRKLLDEIMDVRVMRIFMGLDKSKVPDFKIVTEVRLSLEKGIYNRLFQTDSLIKRYWYSFYLHVKSVEWDISIYQNGGSVKLNELNLSLKILENDYLKFINQMLGRLKLLEQTFNQKIHYP